MTQKHTTTLDTEIEELLKDYNGYDFCGEIACNGQNKANELIQALLSLHKSQVQALIGEDETLEPYEEWIKATKPHGGTRREYDRLYNIINSENNFRHELRTKALEVL